MKELDTAENLHDSIMKNYVVYSRVVPAPEQATDYSKCMSNLERYYKGCNTKFTWSEVDEMVRRVEEYRVLSLVLRDVLFEENGKVGLKNLPGDILVPPLFDAIPERYDCIDCRWSVRATCIPVVKKGRYSLYLMNSGNKEDI